MISVNFFRVMLAINRLTLYSIIPDLHSTHPRCNSPAVCIFFCGPSLLLLLSSPSIVSWDVDFVFSTGEP